MDNENKDLQLEQQDVDETENVMDTAEEAAEEDSAEEKKPYGRHLRKLTTKQKVLKEIREWVVSIAVALLVVFLLRTFVFTIIKVDGGSMKPTLLDEQRLFVTTFDYIFDEPERGDVVICHYPNRYNEIFGIIKTKTCFVKRVVAVEGDTVERIDNVVYVTYGDTGERVAIDEGVICCNPGYDYEYVLGEDEFFVVGDNRGNSHDSRDWQDWDDSRDVGPITGDMIIGKVRYIIWPFEALSAVE